MADFNTRLSALISMRMILSKANIASKAATGDTTTNTRSNPCEPMAPFHHKMLWATKKKPNSGHHSHSAIWLLDAGIFFCNRFPMYPKIITTETRQKTVTMIPVISF